jgi:hypothetical protein
VRAGENKSVADEEFRIAYAAFLRSWIGEEFFARGQSEDDFEDMVNQLVSQDGPIMQMFRSFHAKHGRYPSFAELCPPNMPFVGIVSDI